MLSSPLPSRPPLALLQLFLSWLRLRLLLLLLPLLRLLPLELLRRGAEEGLRLRPRGGSIFPSSSFFCPGRSASLC